MVLMTVLICISLISDEVKEFPCPSLAIGISSLGNVCSSLLPVLFY